MSNSVDLVIPDIGGSNDVNVANVYIKVGDHVNVDQDLLMLETDKATMEVPSCYSGVITSVKIKVNDKVNEGDVIATIELSSQKEEPINTQESECDISCDVVVLGAGPGGYTAAFRAADLGQKVVLIEKHATLGGVCLNVGCIPSKALLHVAHVINDAKNIKSHGVDFGAPTINLEKIRHFKEGVVSKLTGGLSALAKTRKVNVVRGIGKFSSSNTITVDDKTVIRFNSAIIACGSSVAKIPQVPYEDPRIIDSTQALELKDVPKKMLVIGGGIIGLELSEVYSSLGSEITIVELSDSLLPGVDKDAVKVLENRIKDRYKGIHTKTKCASIVPTKLGLEVTFEGNYVSDKPILFDKILIAVGRKPNGLSLNLEAIGVTVQSNGYIPVNNQCRTNVQHIYAIGDVVGQPMLAHKATHEGRVAAENCAKLKSFFDARVIPGVCYTDPEIAWVGVTETEAKVRGLDVDVAKFPWAASGRALGSAVEDGFTKIITDKLTHKVIGATIVGTGASELLAEVCLGIEMDCDIHDIGLTIHAHPTLSESIALSCEMIDGSITDLYVPKKK